MAAPGVSHAFHSPLIEPIVPDFEKWLAGIEFQAVQLPFYSTVTGAAAGARELAAPAYWSGQFLKPVQFLDTIQAMARDGYDLFLEIGSGDTLTAFTRRSLDPAKHLVLSSLRKGAGDRRRMLSAAGELYRQGQEIAWSGVQTGLTRRVALPNYPFQRKKYWLDLEPAAAPARAHEVQKEFPLDRRQRISEQVVSFLAQVGGLAPQDVNREQNLMEMGLDSLMLVKVGQLVEREFGVELQFRQFFRELSSINDLAAYIEQHGTITERAPVTAARGPSR